jgi:hypothetical protein
VHSDVVFIISSMLVVKRSERKLLHSFEAKRSNSNAPLTLRFLVILPQTNIPPPVGGDGMKRT